MLIAVSLLDRRKAVDGGQCVREEGERAMLQLAYPILIGRQEPKGHPKYPGMGSFFHVEGGGGQYIDRPSPPTNASVAQFLLHKALMPAGEANKALQRGIAATVHGLTALQGCQVWTHPADLEPAELTKGQRDLIGKGYAGPPVDLDGVALTAEQRALCRGGLDEEQLRMLKAQIHCKLADCHEIIDRAVDAHIHAAFQEEGIDTALSLGRGSSRRGSFARGSLLIGRGGSMWSQGRSAHPSRSGSLCSNADGDRGGGSMDITKTPSAASAASEGLGVGAAHSKAATAAAWREWSPKASNGTAARGHLGAAVERTESLQPEPITFTCDLSFSDRPGSAADTTAAARRTGSAGKLPYLRRLSAARSGRGESGAEWLAGPRRTSLFAAGPSPAAPALRPLGSESDGPRADGPPASEDADRPAPHRSASRRVLAPPPPPSPVAADGSDGERRLFGPEAPEVASGGGGVVSLPFVPVYGKPGPFSRSFAGFHSPAGRARNFYMGQEWV